MERGRGQKDYDEQKEKVEERRRKRGTWKQLTRSHSDVPDVPRPVNAPTPGRVAEHLTTISTGLTISMVNPQLAL